MTLTDPEDSKKEKTRGQVKSYLHYTGMAFQLFGILLIGILVGKWLDNYFNLSKNFITAGLTLFLVTGYFIKLYYDLNKK